MILVFSGTDGAGKSTQIERLKTVLTDRGLVIKYLWSRGGYTPIFSMIKSFLRLLLRKKMPKQGVGDKRKKIIEKKSVSKVWLTVSIIDLMLLYGIYVRWQNLFGRVVICDRYIGDTLIDFKRNFPSSFDEHGFLWKLLNKVSPNPDHSFLLYVPVKTSQRRSLEKNEPFPDSKETLEFRLKFYLDNNFFPPENYKVICCETGIEEIHQEILKEVAIKLQ